MPYVKSGAQRKVETNSALMVSEAEALVRTLEWKVLQQLTQFSLRATSLSNRIQVVDSIAIGLSSFKKKYLFGTGNLERLRALVIGNDRITAVSAILEIDETDPMQGLPQPLPVNSCSTASARGPV